MKYPTLYSKDSSRQIVDAFKGYNHNLRIGDGEFFDMKNMTSDYYPVLSPRKKRGVYASLQNPTGLIAKDALCYVDGTKFVINEYPVEMGLNNEPKQLISMGAYVIILPDKKYINTADISDFGCIEASFISSGDVSFSLCKIDGSEYEETVIGTSPPTKTDDEGKVIDDGDKLWIDTSSSPHVLKQYATASSMWVTIPTTYIKISAPNIGANFAQYDGITVSGVVKESLGTLNSNMVVQNRDTNYIVVAGILDETAIQTASQGAVAVSRTMPVMDFVTEAGNRLWGCRYGPDVNGNVVNEIYCSKLGDFKNWNCFAGVSTDSYVASVGTDGQFTGAITHLGYPLFFKEGCLHKVYGSFPANFQIQTTACRGVQKGSHKSLAIVNEVLYYKSRLGICAYDGSLPTEVSSAFGDVAYFDAVGGAHGNKYYISMADSEQNGNYHLFVLDTAKGFWHKEDNTQVTDFCSCRNEMYFIDGADGCIKTIFGNGAACEKHIPWMAETGIIGVDSPDKKYISKMNVRMAMDAGSTVTFYIEYDSTGCWEYVCTMPGTSLRTFTAHIRPKRCDHMRLRIVGEGSAKIFSICKTIEQGSDA